MADGGRPRLLVDIDGVLAETDAVLREICRAVTGGRVALEHDDRVTYDIRDTPDGRGHRLTPEEWERAHAAFAGGDRIGGLAERPGAGAALRSLAVDCDLVVATSRPAAARRPTIAWLERALDGVAYELHFAGGRNKHLIGGLAAAVDDDYDQAALFAAAGVPCFLPAWPWNRPRHPDRPALGLLAWGEDWAELERGIRRVLAAGPPGPGPPVHAACFLAEERLRRRVEDLGRDNARLHAHLEASRRRMAAAGTVPEGGGDS